MTSRQYLKDNIGFIKLNMIERYKHDNLYTLDPNDIKEIKFQILEMYKNFCNPKMQF